MKQEFIDERTGISYTLQGDYYLPDLTSPEHKHEIGCFGQAHARYLKEHEQVTYIELLTSGKLNQYLHDVDTSAQEMYERLIRRYVTEQLKADSQMEWVGRINNIASAVREVVNSELIYT